AHGGEVEGVKYDSLDRFLLYTSPVEIRCTFLGLMRTNLCASWAHNWSLGARIIAVCLGVQILISASNKNKVIDVIKCSFLDLFVDILFLTVKIHLPLHLHFFASGQTCEIGRGSNTYFPHCTYTHTHRHTDTQTIMHSLWL